MAKVQIIQKLIDDGFFTTKKEAEAYILAGHIQADGVRVTGNIKVDRDARLQVFSPPYSGKGGLKLEHALDAFHLDVTGKICIDAGASTGGFTDCLIKRGAGRVYAVDVGFGQLTGSLRQNARVVNLERTNISHPSLLELDPAPSFGSIDVSYLSLKKAVPYFCEILHQKGDLVCLVKPLFEINDPDARRTGVIPDDEYRPLLEELVQHFDQPGIVCTGVTYSPVTGNRNTREFFLHLVLGNQSSAMRPDLKDEICNAVEQALRLKAFKKA